MITACFSLEVSFFQPNPFFLTSLFFALVIIIIIIIVVVVIIIVIISIIIINEGRQQKRSFADDVLFKPAEMAVTIEPAGKSSLT